MHQPTTSTPEAEQLLCPMCDYDLRGQRGQAEPRCPECGYRFEWDELTDPARRLHPYLFEHHPKRNVRSFFRTLIGGWRPRRFWTTLHPGQPSRPRRLMGYLIITCITCVLGGLILPTATWAIRYDHVLDTRAFIIARINAGSLRLPPGMTAKQFAVQSAPAPTLKEV